MPDDSLPFQEAIDYLRNKITLPTRTWTDLLHGMHARAFVVAGATKAQLLTDFHQAVTRAIAEGRTPADFRKDFDRIVAAHGWSHNGSAGWRSGVIYNTNLRMAHAAGRYAQIQEVKESRPYQRYSAILDGRTRDKHAQWHGTILPVDHPWWDTHTPPCGWNCRCTVQSVSEADLKRYGWTVSAEAPAINEESRSITLSDGSVKTLMVPEGIDTGFGYNPGKAAWGQRLAEDVMNGWRGAKADAWERLTEGDWQSAGRPAKVPTDQPVAALGPSGETAEDLRRMIEAAIGGKEAAYTLPSGDVVAVDAAALAGHMAPNRGPYIPFLPELLSDPYEVWLAFERHKGTGRVELRLRVIKVVELNKDATLTAVAQVVKGRLEAWTFVPGNRATQINRSRVGSLLYGRQVGALSDAAERAPGDG